MKKLEIENCKNNDEFIKRSVLIITAHMQKALATQERFLLCLSGGSTPRPIYAALGAQDDIDWQKVTVFLCDERYVPADHPDSNQGMIRDTFATRYSLLATRFPDTTLPLEECVTDYASTIQSLWKSETPDLAILGMGPDGHTASLFPPLSDAQLQDEPCVLHTTTDQFAIHDRITLSLNALTTFKHCIILLTGKEKQSMWKDMMASNEDKHRWPVKRILAKCDTTVITDWQD